MIGCNIGVERMDYYGKYVHGMNVPEEVKQEYLEHLMEDLFKKLFTDHPDYVYGAHTIRVNVFRDLTPDPREYRTVFLVLSPTAYFTDPGLSKGPVCGNFSQFNLMVIKIRGVNFLYPETIGYITLHFDTNKKCLSKDHQIFSALVRDNEYDDLFKYLTKCVEYGGFYEG